MRPIHRQFSLILALAMVLSLTACGRPSAGNGGNGAAEYEMKVGLATANDAQDKISIFFAEEVERLSGGRIKGSVYNASQLGNNDKMNQDIRTGAQEAIVQPAGFSSAYIPTLGVLDLPFLFPNDEVQTKVLNSDGAKPLYEAAKAADVEIVAFFAGGTKMLVTSFPVTKMEDLKGRKFRSIPSPELVGQFTAFGAIGVPMALGEVYTALQQGTVEGAENPVDVITKMKHHEVAKYVTETKHGALSSLIMVSKAWMDSLPADLQQAVRDAGKSAATEALQVYGQAREDARAELAKDNVQIAVLAEAERAKLKTASEKVYTEIKTNAAKAAVLESLTKAIAAEK